MEAIFGEYWGLTLAMSLVLTWGIGLAPPLLLRFVFFRRPFKMWSAVGTVVVFWMFNLLLFLALGSQSKTHTALLLIAMVSFFILRKGAKEQQLEHDNIKTPTPEKNISATSHENRDGMLGYTSPPCPSLEGQAEEDRRAEGNQKDHEEMRNRREGATLDTVSKSSIHGISRRNNFFLTIVQLALVCLFVGFLLAFFDIDPVALMHNFPDAIQSVFEVVADLIRWAIPYVILGAVVVVPIWLVFFLLRLARGRRN